jgi:4-diphosphocytidyl-2-C-methyl-D-erythritol kinase
VEQALHDLSCFGKAKLTGTGACVFAEFESEQQAVSAYQVLAKKWQVYLTKGVNKSPLLTKLEKF